MKALQIIKYGELKNGLSFNETAKPIINASDVLIETKAAGLIYSIVKPGALTNEKSTGKIELKEKLKKQGSISRADVAQTLVEVLEDDLKKNQAFEIITGDARIKKAVTNY
ncbi:MAG: NADPH:quinone reductase-like Zn-dependent oxidoreductase [Arenicella sp.]|jgi:NADPH:quinone reductase-like Zn-dependent oxidoreductase